MSEIYWKLKLGQESTQSADTYRNHIQTHREGCDWSGGGGDVTEERADWTRRDEAGAGSEWERETEDGVRR